MKLKERLALTKGGSGCPEYYQLYWVAAKERDYSL